MKKLELPDRWEQDPDLRLKVSDLSLADRRRSAIDILLGLLRQDYENIEYLYLALTVAGTGSGAQLEALEPPTPQQLSSALLAPIATECSNCGHFWYSYHLTQVHAGRAVAGGANPSGLQCQACRYTMCNTCLSRQLEQSHLDDIDKVEVVGGPCPGFLCGGTLTTPVLPTGRGDVMSVDPNGIEGIAVIRDGIIPPTLDEALAVVTRFVPLTSDDGPLIHVRGSAPGLMSDNSIRDGLALTLVTDLERNGVLAPGAWSRSRRIHVVNHSSADTNYLVIVVGKLELALTPKQATDASGGGLSARRRPVATKTSFTYVVLTRMEDGGWGRLPPTAPFSVGLMSTAERVLPTVAAKMMSQIATASNSQDARPRWRIVFFNGDRRNDAATSLPDALGFVDEGSQLLRPMSKYSDPPYTWIPNESSQNPGG